MSNTANRRQVLSALGASSLAACARSGPRQTHLLNVSYDPTREFYAAYNARFAHAWAKAHGSGVRIDQSHGGSGKQARSVIEGLQADVVTLALAYDIDAIAKRGLLAADWQKRLPDNSTPFTSTIVFLVRKGNPKSIRDWPDLVRQGAQVVTPNPKTSGGARWNFLAAWAWAQKQGGDTAAETYLRELFAHVPVLDTGARGATISFAQRQIGDVLIGWENDALLTRKQLGDQVEIVRPSYSILAEPPVAVVDKIVDAHGARSVAQAYLETLWREWAQDLGAQHFFRPRAPAVAAHWTAQFPDLPMATIAEFGGWQAAQQRFFADGGVFDRISQPKH